MLLATSLLALISSLVALFISITKPNQKAYLKAIVFQLAILFVVFGLITVHFITKN